MDNIGGVIMNEQQDAFEITNDDAHAALRVLLDLMDDDALDPKIRAQAAKTVLDAKLKQTKDKQSQKIVVKGSGEEGMKSLISLLRGIMSKTNKGSLHLDVGTFTKLCEILQVKNQSTSKMVPLSLNAEQRVVIKDIIENDRVMVLKGRQAGISTLCLAYISAMVITYPGIYVGIFVDEAKKATEMLGKVAVFIESIGSYIGVDLIDKKNTELCRLTNGSTIVPQTASSQSSSGESRAGRSYSFDILHFSEMAFYAQGEALFAAATSSATIQAKIIIESTSNGKADHFYKLWSTPNNGYKKGSCPSRCTSLTGNLLNP